MAGFLGAESIGLEAADSRIIAEDVRASVNVPGFDNSAMDGYAVMASDVAAASADSPATLHCTGTTAAGQVSAGGIGPGKCLRVFTGSPLPAGADAVVMQEDTRVDGAQPDRVQILDAVRPWENVRFAGEDIKAGSSIIARGQKLNAATLGLLSAVGVARVQVARAPVVGLLATGNELREAGQPLQPGQIYESNRLCFATLARHAGALTRVYPLVADSLKDTQAAMETALAECDAIVTSGGVSVGEFDFVKDAFTKTGGKLDFWRVAIKPGKPFVCGQRNHKLFFGLPGNPVSGFVTFLVLVRPALMAMQGARAVHLPASTGTLAEPLSNRGDRRHFMRVHLGEQGDVRSAGTQASHMLSSLALANGLVDVPPDTTLASGTSVRVLRWD